MTHYDVQRQNKSRRLLRGKRPAKAFRPKIPMSNDSDSYDTNPITVVDDLADQWAELLIKGIPIDR